MNKHRGPERRNRRIEDYPKLCMFCAKEISDDQFSAEHFVPQGFYEKSLRQKVDLAGLELPAHKNCNNSFSADNEYFRNVIAGGLGTEISVGAKALVNGSISNFMKNSSAEKLEATYKNIKHRPAFTESGILLENKPSIEVEWSRIERVLFNIMKGIFFKVKKKPMPADFHLSVHDASTLSSEVVHHNIKAMVPWQTISGDPDVFQCRYAFQEVNEKVTEAHFYIQLFKTHHFLGGAHSKESLVKHQKRELFKSSPKSKILIPYYSS